MDKLKNNELSNGHIERIGDSVMVNGKTITFDELAYEYGPEGLYEIANKLWSLADNDINFAIKQSLEE